MEYDGKEYYLTQLTQPMRAGDCSLRHVDTVEGHVTTRIYTRMGKLYAGRDLPGTQHTTLYRMHLQTERGSNHG